MDLLLDMQHKKLKELSGICWCEHHWLLSKSHHKKKNFFSEFSSMSFKVNNIDFTYKYLTNLLIVQEVWKNTGFSSSKQKKQIFHCGI